MNRAMVCWVYSRLNIRVPRDVEASPEWRRRVTVNLEAPAMGFGSEWRRPRHWNWRKALSDRAMMLANGYAVPEMIDAEVARLATAGEVRWAERFFEKTQDNEWCLTLGQFDARCLDGSPAFARGGNPTRAMQDRRVCRDVRRWRHRHQGLFLEWMTEADCLTEGSIFFGDYARVPEGWARFEVPYGLRVDMPTVLRCWGMEMARSPYLASDQAWSRGPLAHSLWSAFFTQWARNVAHALLSEAHLPGPSARLWWLPRP